MAPAYEVELSQEANEDLRAIKPFHRGTIVTALTHLRNQAEVATQNRKPLEEPLDELPEAAWEVRVGEYRAFYEVKPPDEETGGRTVRVLRVIMKGAAHTRE